MSIHSPADAVTARRSLSWRLREHPDAQADAVLSSSTIWWVDDALSQHLLAMADDMQTFPVLTADDVRLPEAHSRGVFVAGATGDLLGYLVDTAPDSAAVSGVLADEDGPVVTSWVPMDAVPADDTGLSRVQHLSVVLIPWLWAQGRLRRLRRRRPCCHRLRSRPRQLMSARPATLQGMDRAALETGLLLDIKVEWDKYEGVLDMTTFEVAQALATHLNAVEPCEVEDLAGGYYGCKFSRPRGEDGRWSVVIGVDTEDGWWLFGEHPEGEQQPVVMVGTEEGTSVWDVLGAFDLVTRDLTDRWDGSVDLAELKAAG